MVDELALADLILTSGSSVLAFGSVQHPGAQYTTHSLVAGTWDGRGILNARWISSKQNEGAFIPAPPDSRPAISVSEEESGSVFLELDRRFEAVLLSSGGSRLRSYVQTRNVVPGMAEFFDKLYERTYPLDLYVSIMPCSE